MSKLTVSTTQLQALVNKANQCVGYNKLIEVTNIIGIKAVDNTLRLITTDATHTLYVSMPIDSDVEINVAVKAEVFIKLINKITSATVTLEFSDNSLTVSGNGKYKLVLEVNDEGELLSFPDSTLQDDANEIGKITQSNIQTIQTSLKASLSKNAGSMYTNYYVGEFVCATDKAMMGMYDLKVFNGDDEFLITSTFIDLLAYAGEDVQLLYNDKENVLVAEATDFMITTKLSRDTMGYQVDGIKKMISLEQESMCKFNKQSMLDLLDRLALFVGAYDDGAITLEFTSNCVKVSSQASTGIETVDYSESKNIKEQTIKININRLVAQLKGYASDTVELYFGSSVCIKLVDGNITQVIALMK